MSKKYFDQGDFKKGAFFIDSTGARYELIEAHFVRGSLNPVRWFRPSPAIIVDIEIGPPSQLTLDQVKETVISYVIRYRWYHQGHQSESEFRNMITSAQSYLDLIKMISFYGTWQG
ncbi:hypothetical protein [Ralstonia pseudosolanacearum]|nr:hypothetical protein [Ralstonia pseudosolanacearum]MDO3510258.1 hypothetical protein [Ralstonia pseudosolanacearum]MDO3515221.1 hypothetical protein [Ralstonia pseudosolanacearum]MDO3524782.1 hypothetical protein [Ralstonia pseudosolanacearum]MDO3539941.1 hypothetical protein [Ralstonia pseudosolanacearum]MDO3549811.1 hypothetical protein [Ralstonia pseudosolanacearum]